MNLGEKMEYKCNLCGSKMLNQSNGPYIHFVCPDCGNSIATYDSTKDDPIKLDDTIYIVKSINNNSSNEILKIISKYNGKNYIKCKEILEKNDVMFSGKAIDIIEVLKLLKKYNFQYEINPEFKYKI